MKRFAALMLALLFVLSLVACKAKPIEPETPVVEDPTEAPTEVPTEEPVLEAPAALMDRVQAVIDAVTLEIMLMPMEADLTDPDGMLYNFGLSDMTDVEQAILAEPMMSAIAFSSGMVRVKEGGDVEAVKKAIFDNLDMRKWICVNADVLLVSSSGNDIYFVMSDATIAGDLMAAFRAQNADATEPLERAFGN